MSERTVLAKLTDHETELDLQSVLTNAMPSPPHSTFGFVYIAHGLYKVLILKHAEEMGTFLQVELFVPLSGFNL